MKSLYIVNSALATALISWTLALGNDNNTNKVTTNNDFNASVEIITAETKKQVFQFIPKYWYIIPTDEKTIEKLIELATEQEEDLDETNKLYYGCKNINWDRYYIFNPEITISTDFFIDATEEHFKKLKEAPVCENKNPML